MIARIFRLFISSTFADFKAERQALQDEVFPKLQKFCRERGARFEAIDLRWGITEAAQKEHDTMRICLEEVRRCQQTSPRPNFAVLLGDRYGWEPVPARIPLDHWDRLMVQASEKGRQLIEKAYRLDLNAVPPVYRLRKRGTDMASEFELEVQLLQALRHAARRFRGKNRLPYFASATHQEIWLGAMDAPDAAEHVYVYARRIQGLRMTATDSDFIDWDAASGQVIEGARDRVKALGRRLQARLPGKVRVLSTRLLGGKVSKSYLERFCSQFLADQTGIIERELAKPVETQESVLRDQVHAQFAAERARVFTGRGRLLSRIDAYLRRPDPVAPLILCGAGGSGKSALLAKAYLYAVESVKSRRAKLVVIPRFIGGVPGTEALITLLSTLICDIAHAYGASDPAPPENIKDATTAFEASLSHASAERPLVLFLDALDQLDGADGALLLEWLPKKLPAHARVVASTRSDPTQPNQSLSAAERSYSGNLLLMPAMSRSEASAMLDAWLASRCDAWFNAGIAPAVGRALTRRQRGWLMGTADGKAAGNPLWLKLAYEEAHTWPSWRPIGDETEVLPATVEGMVQRMIRRLTAEEGHLEAFSQRALAYLAAGRFGLTEEELALALATDPVVTEEFIESTRRTGQAWAIDPARPRLPPILWSRLYFDLQPYLGQVSMDGTLLMRYFHREFKQVIEHEILVTLKVRDAVHGHLADVFHALAPEGDDLFKKTDVGGRQDSAALRRIMEQPWQLGQAGRRWKLDALLTDFGFCMGKCAANRSDDLVLDFNRDAIPKDGSSPYVEWRALVQGQAHVLRRATKAWPAHKILLQIATDRSDGGPTSAAVEKWLQQDHCDWVWIRRKVRPDSYLRDHCLTVLEGHRAPVLGAELLSESRLLSWSDDGTLRLWDMQTGVCVSVLEGHKAAVAGAHLLPENRILSWSNDGTLRVWDIETGACALVLDEGTAETAYHPPVSQWVRGARLLADGRILSWSGSGTLRLWDGQSGVPLAVLEGHKGDIDGAQVLVDGRILSWSSRDGTMRLWDGKSGAPLTVLERQKKGDLVYGGALVLTDGRILWWSGDTLCVWDGQSNAPLALLEGHKKGIGGALVLVDGRILSWSADGTLRLWDGQSGAPLALLEGHKQGIGGAQVLVDGRILSWSHDGSLRLWDGQSGAPLALLEGHTTYVSRADALPNGRILSCSYDGTLRVWDGGSGAMLAALQGHNDFITGYRLLTHGRVVSWSTDATLRLWSTKIEGAMSEPDHELADWARDIEILPDGRVLSWGYGSTLRLWDSETGTQLAVLEGHRDSVTGARVLADGNILSWSFDSTLRLWDGKTGAAIAVLSNHVSWILGAEYLSDGRILSRAADLKIWDGKTGMLLATLEGHTAFVDGASLLRDGRILSWSRDDTLRLWDGKSGAPLALLEGHKKGIGGAQVLVDGRILSWSHDGSLRLWDGQSGASLAVFEGHTKDVTGAQVLADGRILSWSDDGTLRLWNMQTGVCISVLEGHKAAVNGAHRLADGRILSWSNDGTLRLWDGKNGVPLRLQEAHITAVAGVRALSDGRIFSWSSDGTLCLWDGELGECLGVMPPDWVESSDFPQGWMQHAKYAGVLEQGDWWVKAHGNRVSIASALSEDRGRWHGPSEYYRYDGRETTRVVGVASSGGITIMAGNRLRFLQAYCGTKPLNFVCPDDAVRFWD